MDILKALSCGIVAWLSWQTHPALIPVSLLFPAITMTRPTRKLATLAALAYWGTASWPVVQTSAAYFAGGAAAGIIPWITATAILSAPSILLWVPERSGHWWRIPAALIVSTVPPIGIINWASPLTAAGLLFPGLGFAGLMATVAVQNRRLIIPLGLISVAANAIHRPSAPPEHWTAISTKFGSIHNPTEEFAASEQIQQIANGSGAKVIVFPAALVNRWTEATDAFWQPTIDSVREGSRTILIGAGSNAVVIRGAASNEIFEQRIPVPLATWKPWGRDRTRLNLTGKAIIEIAGERAAVLIGYEQLLPLAYLTALAKRPTVLVGVANASWSKHTVIPKYQDAVLRSWGRLFSTPVISATNY